MLRPLAPTLERGLAAQRPLPGVADLRASLARLQEQAVTGLRVNRASDDPQAYAQARRFEAEAGRLEQYGRAVQAARLWADETALALDAMTTLAGEAVLAGTRAANETFSEADREAMASRVEALAEQLVARLNARVGDEYVFGGNRTDAPPFDAAGAPTGDLSGRRVRAIGPETRLAVNVPGTDVHEAPGVGSIPEAFAALAAALRSGERAPLQQAIAGMERVQAHYAETAGRYGETAARLTDAAYVLDDAAVLVARRRSEAEDADMYTVIAEMQRAQTQLEIALRTAADAQQRTLLDYLR
ncbi:MAG: flagellin [Rubricoccaceae bacterium]